MLDIEKHSTRHNLVIEPNSRYPIPYVRFDWINPVKLSDGSLSPIPDYPIPEELASNYIDVHNAKITAKFVSEWLTDFFSKVGLELVDICYFMNEAGTRIHSEITPDGMRLKARDGSSFDKDLFRSGKPKQEIVKAWKVALDALLRYYENE